MSYLRRTFTWILCFQFIALSTCFSASSTDSIERFNQLSEQMKSIPKSELHLHLGGAWPLAYLKEISKPQEYADLCLMLDKIQGGDTDYHSAFRVFSLIGKIINSDEKVENGVIALCQELAQDNVVYAEYRTGLKDLGSGLEGHLNAVLRGIKKGSAGTSLKAGLLLSLRRDTSAAIAEKTIDLALKYREDGVIGIDISGDSTQGDGKNIQAALMRAKENGLPITLHIGESKEESAEQQMNELLSLQPRRIGHGVHLCPEAQQWVRDNKVLVEMCITSSIMAGMLTDPSDHPGIPLLLEGHPVAICTDDPLVFNTTLSQEYAHVALITGLTKEEIQELQKQNYNFEFGRD